MGDNIGVMFYLCSSSFGKEGQNHESCKLLELHLIGCEIDPAQDSSPNPNLYKSRLPRLILKCGMVHGVETEALPSAFPDTL